MRHTRFVRSAALVIVSLVVGSTLPPLAGDESTETPVTVYELRTYTTAEGRLPDLNKRFREHTMRLFEKHGMKNIGYWVPVDKGDTLVYLISHRSREHAKRSWDAFREDPQWKEVSAASRKNGRIVTKVESQYLRATDYSPIP